MSKTVANIHDAFFKQALGDPGLAGTFLSEHLPQEIADLLELKPPEPIPGCFVDEELRQHQSDLLFRIRLKAGRDALAYVLMEHKSSPDPGARLQLLRYVVRVLVRWYDQNKQRLPLPPVLPLLAHQGPEGWEISCEFADLFGSVPDPLRPYVPNFRHALVDLGKLDDADLSSVARLRAFLKALKYGRRGDLAERIDVVLAEVPGLDEKDLLVILTYLDRGSKVIDSKMVWDTIERLDPDRKDLVVGCITRPFYEKGIAEGEARGEARGEAKVLARLLEKRFKFIPAAIRERIFAADVATLEEWVERACDGRDLQAIFEPN